MAARDDSVEHSETTASPWKRSVQRFFGRTDVELTIGGLIVVSVALTLLELSVHEPGWQYWLQETNYAITVVFAFELLARGLAAPSRKRFFREFWIDIVSVLPLLRPLRMFRLLRLLRLLRILRLMGIFSRHMSSFPYIVKRGAIEYMMATGLIVLVILFATGAMLTLERDNPDFDTFPEALMGSIYTLFSGEPMPGPPQTLGGHLIVIFVMFMGMTVFAMFTGTVSAFMIERLSGERISVDWSEFTDHTIICGWNRKAEIIVREYQLADPHADLPIVVIAELDQPADFLDASLKNRVQFLEDDFTKVTALKKAGIERARRCIVLSDTGHNRTPQDADARTILAALTVERINPSVYTCAELHNREYGTHLEMGGVNDYVVTGEHSGFLLAQAALNRGLISVFTELLTQERGNQFYRIAIHPAWRGRSFVDLFLFLKQRHNAILVAVEQSGNGLLVNPGDLTFDGTEQLIMISEKPLDPSTLVPPA